MARTGAVGGRGGSRSGLREWLSTATGGGGGGRYSAVGAGGGLCGRAAKLTRCQYLLGVVVPLPQDATAASAAGATLPAAPARRCPQCGGELVVVEGWPRPRACEVRSAAAVAAAVVDKS